MADDHVPEHPQSHLKVDFARHINENCPKTGDAYLVVGGCGFLGKRIVEVLLERGERNIAVFDIATANKDYNIIDPRVKHIPGDVTNLSNLKAACADIDTVFATFAVIRFMERLNFQRSFSERINIGGTANLLKACESCGVKRLIQTSTSHVSVGFGQCSLSMTEDDPYVDRSNSFSHYGYTKAEAEKLVLKANNSAAGGGALQTVAIRPCSGIFGPKDGLVTERALSKNEYQHMGSEGKDAFQDLVYVDNVVYGHLLAENKLRNGDNGIAGEAFCISNNEPLNFGKFWERVQHYRPELKVAVIPYFLCWMIAYIMEALQYTTRGSIKGEISILTPAMLQVSGAKYAFCIDKAQRVLGYEPLYTMNQGIQRVVWESDKRRKEKKPKHA
eukprot:CAMPEP_0194239550 /NCGR_PEP_ID=MMETSP0158-20130606/5971_1 /TAXON_ID=33649 /ORGANISM="Thalassionema nitzschioides, Strain L26-B" /LENGTH=387 /DNA_ID=CAMNT_0038974039 /DNA_START=118 /DNA_END=1281 /DNA_ORIENTATION=+